MYDHEFLIFTTLPPDLNVVDGPRLSELERVCKATARAEAFQCHLAAERQIWKQMDRGLSEIDSEEARWRVAVPYQCLIHEMRLELMADLKRGDQKRW